MAKKQEEYCALPTMLAGITLVATTGDGGMYLSVQKNKKDIFGNSYWVVEEEDYLSKEVAEVFKVFLEHMQFKFSPVSSEG